MEKDLNIRDFLILAEHIREKDKLMKYVGELDKPLAVCGVPVPESLNDITFGKLSELMNINDANDLIMVTCRVLLGLDAETIMRADAFDVMGFVMFVSREVERIGKLFASTNVEPSPEEVRAGIRELNFGMFGLVDYFAKRMGITDHEQVMSFPWVRIYKCLEIDSKNTAYERRLRKVYAEKK